MKATDFLLTLKDSKMRKAHTYIMSLLKRYLGSKENATEWFITPSKILDDNPPFVLLLLGDESIEGLIKGVESTLVLEKKTKVFRVSASILRKEKDLL